MDLGDWPCLVKKYLYDFALNGASNLTHTQIRKQEVIVWAHPIPTNLEGQGGTHVSLLSPL